MQLIPLLLLSADQQDHEVCSNRKINGLIGNDHRVEISVEALQTLVEHGDQVRSNGVHLGVKLAADDAVAEVDEAGARIAFDLAARIL